jgi:hypothetical protein
MWDQQSVYLGEDSNGMGVGFLRPVARYLPVVVTRERIRPAGRNFVRVSSYGHREQVVQAMQMIEENLKI